MRSPQQLREAAKEARDQARVIADPLIKARLHEIAGQLEALADQLEQGFDPDRRS